MEETVDPVLRCDSCQKLLLTKELTKLGVCDKCGNRRVRNLTIFNLEEKKQMEDWGLAEFLKKFEEVAK